MTSTTPSTTELASGNQYMVQSGPLVISGGQFNQWNNNITTVDSRLTEYQSLGYKHLEKKVATKALHSSVDVISPPKCYPGTRTAVLKNSMDWIEMSRINGGAWIMWIYGAAGAGKSAIKRSMTEQCIAKGFPTITFFFCKMDKTRNNIRPLVATLAYQLAEMIPSSLSFICHAINTDPLIFHKSFSDQLEKLILNPVRQTVRPSPAAAFPSPLLILIDGLDECEDQAAQIDFLQTLSAISPNKNILFLITSRPEAHLEMAFSAIECNGTLTRLALDGTYSPHNDILLFVNGRFAEILATHPLRRSLDPAWPPRILVDHIVEMSSGQFIYAAVVVDYVSSATAHPVERLEVCCGRSPAGLDKPFQSLDELFRDIFSRVHDMKRVRPLLARALYDSTDIQFINDTYGYSRGSVESGLSELTSIISCKGGRINFLHPSLLDFLSDSSRSLQYGVNPGVWCEELAISWFRSPTALERGSLRLIRFLEYATPTPELRNELMRFAPEIERNGGYFNNVDLVSLVDVIKTLEFSDGPLYTVIREATAQYLEDKFADEHARFLENHPPVSSPALPENRMNNSGPLSWIKKRMKPRINGKRPRKGHT